MIKFPFRLESISLNWENTTEELESYKKYKYKNRTLLYILKRYVQ
jgi:hypothetical protein